MNRDLSQDLDAGADAGTPRAADRIRQSARELFYRDGIRAVGVDAIVSRSGATKPSLYRSFASKDELAADYLRAAEDEFWVRFEAVLDSSQDARARIRLFFEALGTKACGSDYRGCGLTNAAIEFPEAGHPARQVSEGFKTRLRARLAELCEPLGVDDPRRLADGMLLLVEGCYATGQIFRADGPARAAAWAADALVEAALRAAR